MVDAVFFAIIVKPTYITQLQCCAPNCLTLCLNFSRLFPVYMYCSVPRRDKFAGWNLQFVHFYAVAMDILNLNTGIFSKFHFLQRFSEILQCSSGCSSSVIFAPPDTLTWLILTCVSSVLSELQPLPSRFSAYSELLKQWTLQITRLLQAPPMYSCDTECWFEFQCWIWVNVPLLSSESQPAHEMTIWSYFQWTIWILHSFCKSLTRLKPCSAKNLVFLYVKWSCSIQCLIDGSQALNLKDIQGESKRK